MDTLILLLIAAIVGLLVRWIVAMFLDDKIAVLIGLLVGILVFIGRLH